MSTLKPETQGEMGVSLSGRAAPGSASLRSLSDFITLHIPDAKDR